MAGLAAMPAAAQQAEPAATAKTASTSNASEFMLNSKASELLHARFQEEKVPQHRLSIKLIGPRTYRNSSFYLPRAQGISARYSLTEKLELSLDAKGGNGRGPGGFNSRRREFEAPGEKITAGMRLHF
jgi:hypothetical protein